MKYKKHWRASLTVEAALVFPIFFFAVLAFLYFIQVIYMQENIQQGLTEVAKKTSTYAYLYQEYQGAEDQSADDEVKIGEYIVHNIVASTFLKLQFLEVMQAEGMDVSCIRGGINGISFLGSSVMQEDENINIRVHYQLDLPIRLFDLSTIKIRQSVKSRGFVGRMDDDKEKDAETEEKVYITPTGTVYHKRKTCTHLQLSVRKVAYSSILSLRNESGSKYCECERCYTSKISSTSQVYITNTGTRYHSQIDCSGIKRNIMEVSISEVGARRPCSRCAQEE